MNCPDVAQAAEGSARARKELEVAKTQKAPDPGLQIVL